MRQREQQSLQFNKVSWGLFRLGEETLLLQGPANVAIEKVHESSKLIANVLGGKLYDLVPSYSSIALFHKCKSEELLADLSEAKSVEVDMSASAEKVQIPICYELGLDLDEVANHAKTSREELIQTHLNGKYKAIFIGFTPGFIYMNGLDKTLACPRRSNPRKFLKPGSVGIGGVQTGIYSLASPGGWNIIGRTPLQIFDAQKKPPMSIAIGSEITYARISEKEFDSWGN